MKSLVTGATGFIGSNVLRQLVNDGHEAVALVRQKSNLDAISDILDRVELRYGDITDKPSILAASNGVRHIYHCAGMARIGPGHVDKLHKINVDGTRHVMEVAKESNVERVVFTSSVSAVGITGTKKPADETQTWNLDELNVPYFKTKHLAEKEVHKAVDDGVDCVIVNPSYVFGPGDINFNAGGLIRDLYYRRIPFYPTGGVCIVDINDVVAGHISAMHNGKKGERYILGGQNVPYKEVFDTICRIVGVPKVNIPMFPSLVKLVLKVTEKARKKHKISALANTEILTSASKFLYYDSSKAIKELGFSQTPFEKTLENTFHWYKSFRLL